MNLYRSPPLHFVYQTMTVVLLNGFKHTLSMASVTEHYSYSVRFAVVLFSETIKTDEGYFVQ
ncbi:MAG: hypothetical protein V1799_19645 [bacterium]